MSDLLEGADLAAKALDELVVLGELGMDQLEDHQALGGLVQGDVGLAKGAGSQLALELESARDHAFGHSAHLRPPGFPVTGPHQRAGG